MQINKGKLSASLIAILFGVFTIWQQEMVRYLWMQGKGQLSIMSNTVPIEHILKSDTLSAKSRFLLELIPEIKSFAKNTLGLIPDDNYTKYYNQNGKPILWALTACPPYSLEAYKWGFPFLGELEYKGFFEKSAGSMELEELRNQGFDVDLGEVGAWSTLGILSDPILSSMLELDTGNFVRLLLHEMTHATVYIADDGVFNENMATFIGDRGAMQFLIQQFGKNSAVVRRYQETLADIELFSEYTVAYSKSINLLYNSLPADATIWPIMKQKSFTAYKNRLYLLPFNHKKRFQKLQESELNNTFFTGFLMYHNQQDSIQKLIKELHSGNIKEWVESLK